MSFHQSYPNRYRLALDVGSTSIGWCILELDNNNQPNSLLDMGVRIFSDGRDEKSKEPLSVARRNARGIRRNLDRKKARQKRLMQLLIKYGLMPIDEDARKQLELCDPYEIRAKAANEKVTLHELGRALFHINQRRGFKSNRKSNKNEKDASSMKTAISKLSDAINDAKVKTLGEYLWLKKKNNETTRVRASIMKNKAEYDFYPNRSMYENEVKCILEEQKKYHHELTDEISHELLDTIFYQRKMKLPDPGYCRFENKEPRIRRAHPLFQKFRILHDINNLELDVSNEIRDATLTKIEREKIIIALSNNKKQKFKNIRKILNFPKHFKFNFETELRDHLRGDDTAAILGKKDAFGENWFLMPIEKQAEIIERLFLIDDEDELVDWLIENYQLPESNVKNIVNAKLEAGYSSLSELAIQKILPGLEEGLSFNKAVQKAYPHHSDFRTGEWHQTLPYYGQVLPHSVVGGSYSDKDKENLEKYYGKINNPTVHIALNQVRKLINSLLEVYGHPSEIVVELARNLKEPFDKLKKEQSENIIRNERINKELEKLDVKQNYRNRMLYKLWEDLAKQPQLRCCPFCNDPTAISLTDLFFSNLYEEEHLLPFSLSFNDSQSNKVIAHRHCNRAKGNKSPFEAFGSDKIRWESIKARIENLPSNKQWRFKENAWEIAKGKGEDVIARMLNDTRYLSRVIRQYLSAIFDNQKGKNCVYAIPGQMTALMREKWGLNELTSAVWKEQLQDLFKQKPDLIDTLINKSDQFKNRDHHFHHAVDAFVVGCTTRGMLKKISDASHVIESNLNLQVKRHKLADQMPQPFEGYLEQIKMKLKTLIISYKPDHGNAIKAINGKKPITISRLHEETTYGLINHDDAFNEVIVATRVPINDFETKKHLEEIADQRIKNQLIQITRNLKEKSPEWKEALGEYSKNSKIRHLRVHIKKSRSVMTPISQSANRGPVNTRGKTYKLVALGGNYRADIWANTKGENAGKWQCEIISNFHAHQHNFIPTWRKKNPTAKLIMSLQIDDAVAYEDYGIVKICRVKKMTNEKVYLRPHQIAKEEKDKLSWSASANQLQKNNARKISVDILGRVKDPMYNKK